MACKSSLELFALDELGTMQYLARGARPRLDLILADAVIEALKKTGVDIGKEISDLRLAQHSISTGPKELTDFYFSSAIPNMGKPAWTSCSLLNNGGSKSAFAVAYWETSKFVFLGEKGQAVGLKLTYRLPASSASAGVVDVDVNGRRVARALVDRTWQTLQLSIPGDCIVDGINEVHILWPTDMRSSEEVLGETADALLAGRLPRFHTVFGEIHSLKVFEGGALGLS